MWQLYPIFFVATPPKSAEIFQNRFGESGKSFEDFVVFFYISMHLIHTAVKKVTSA
jgi:hypothetical protein